MKLEISKGVCLTPIKISDAEEVFAVINTQRTYLEQWLPFVPHTREKQDTVNFIKSVQTADELLQTTFVIRKENRFAGVIGFKNYTAHSNRVELGYWLAAQYQKQGLMIRSVRNLVRLAFEETSVNSIVIKCAEENFPSIAIAIRAGFTYTELEENGEQLTVNTYRDLMVFKLTKRHWKTL